MYAETATLRAQMAWNPSWLSVPSAQYSTTVKASATNERVVTSMSMGGGEIVPLRVQLKGPIADGWRITRALNIEVQGEDDGSYLVSDDVFLVYGQGATLEEAENDYVSALKELYRLVERDASRDAFSKKDLEHLRSYLLPPEAASHAPQEY